MAVSALHVTNLTRLPLLPILVLLHGSICQDYVRHGYIGERTDIFCKYPPKYAEAAKHFCKVMPDGQCGKIRTGKSQRFGFHDDRNNMMATLTLRRVADGDSGEYRCLFVTSYGTEFKTIQFWDLKNIAYEGGEVAFKCTYARGFENASKYFFRKDTYPIVPLIQAMGGERNVTKGPLSLLDSTDDHKFTVTLRGLTTRDSGKYSCGMSKSLHEADHQTERWLIVKSLSRVFGMEGGLVEFPCPYHMNKECSGGKRACRGNEPIECLENGSLSGARFSLTDSLEDPNSFLVTISELQLKDAGIYWCVDFGVAGPRFTAAIELTVYEDSVVS